MRAGLRPVPLFLLLGLLLPARAAEDGPLKRLTADLKKAFPKAVAGDEKAREKVLEAGPLTKECAAEVREKLLDAWPFRGAKPGRDRREIEVGGQKREYGISVPKGYSPKREWPLILSLHGAGGNGPGEIDWTWSRNLADWPGFIAAPSGVPPGAQWFPEQVPFVLAVLRDLRENFRIDGNRVYVNGFSNGGNGAWFYSENFPGLFGAVCTRGGGNPTPHLLANLRRVPAYVIHGELDPVIGVESDRRDAAKLKELGFTVEYMEGKGGSHEPFLGENPKVLEFFLDHPREPWPKRLEFTAPGGSRFRYRFVDLPNGGGNVVAEVKGQTIEVTGPSAFVLWLSDDLLDLDREVVVVRNGTEAFRGIVPRRLGDLLADLEDGFELSSPAFARLAVGQ